MLEWSVNLFLPMPFDLQIGDTFNLAPGCDKTIPVCRDNYDNIINYRGEPYLPGEDILFQVQKAPNQSGKK